MCRLSLTCPPPRRRDEDDGVVAERVPLVGEIEYAALPGRALVDPGLIHVAVGCVRVRREAGAAALQVGTGAREAAVRRGPPAARSTSGARMRVADGRSLDDTARDRGRPAARHAPIAADTP